MHLLALVADTEDAAERRGRRRRARVDLQDDVRLAVLDHLDNLLALPAVGDLAGGGARRRDQAVRLDRERPRDAPTIATPETSRAPRTVAGVSLISISKRRD